jgi:PAS domain S-box-containing protein
MFLRLAHNRRVVVRSERLDLEATLENVSVPSYTIDREGAISWLNGAARRLFGNVVGKHFIAVVAPEYQGRARDGFARKLFGATVTDFELELVDGQGRHVVVDVSSVPLRDGDQIIGVFGLLLPLRVQERTDPMHALTPRQTEVLRLLAEGASTSQIAAELHLSRETVRNHIRHVLRALDAHSRLEALAIARRAGLLD